MADEPSTPMQTAPPSGGNGAPAAPPSRTEMVVVKKYANRRLYNTETSSYITLENLAEMIRAGRDFVVFDAKSGDDITRGVLTQIIVEEESKGSAMLPTAFLRQLIGFYGGNLEGVVPRYLEHSMSSFARQQQQMRTAMERTFQPFLPPGVEEMGRQNMALFERAVSLWNPFSGVAQQGGAPRSDESPHDAEPAQQQDEAAETGAAAEDPEISWMRSEIESLRRQLAVAHAAAAVPPPKVTIPENVRRDPAPAGNGAKPVRRSGRKTGSTP